MFLENGSAIKTEIARLIDEHVKDRPILVAVAFWGLGAENLLIKGQSYKIICNLQSGGTNPEVIRGLRSRADCEVRQLDRLHAKVFVGSTGAVVSSSNFSANGLSLEGSEAEAWFEAGVAIASTDPEHDNATEWFWDLWKQAKTITNDNLNQSFEKWKRRQKAFGKNKGLESEVEPHGDETEILPMLIRSELFGSNMTVSNKIYMAGAQLKKIYEEEVGPLGNHKVKVPAYAANLLWTFSGQEIETKISPKYRFYSPDEVIKRAITQDKKFPKETEEFVAILAQHDDVSEAVRYWADKLLDEWPIPV